MATSIAPCSAALGCSSALLKVKNDTSSRVFGLTKAVGRGGRVRCSKSQRGNAQCAGTGMAASLMGAASAMSISNPALALVDERMSTEGTGLTLGISNNILGWILLGVFGLIWSLYFVYASSLDEDEDSGLSL